MKALPLLASVGVLIFAVTGCTTTEQSKPTDLAKPAQKPKQEITPYPFDTCAVINKPIKDKRPRRRVYDGQEVLFCCAPCVRVFDANPEPWVARIRSAVAQGKPLHLTTIPTSAPQETVVEPPIQTEQEVAM